MRIYNKIRHQLTWEGFDLKFEIEPFGSIEVPDHVYEAMRGQKFPVQNVPIPPEEKAQRVLLEEQDAHKATEGRQLKQRVAALEEQLKAAESANRAEQQEHTGARAQVAELTRKLTEANETIRQLRADQKAAEKLLEETAHDMVAASDKHEAVKAASKPSKK